MTQDRKDVWPTHYLGERIYPEVMAEWLDTIIAVCHKKAEDIGYDLSFDFRREMLELKELVLTGDLGEDMRNHPDIYQRELDKIPASERHKPYKLV